jgi:ATP-binding cassette subfamily B protein
MWNRQREAEEAREKLARADDESVAPNRNPPAVDDPISGAERTPDVPAAVAG